MKEALADGVRNLGCSPSGYCILAPGADAGYEPQHGTALRHGIQEQGNVGRVVLPVPVQGHDHLASRCANACPDSPALPTVLHMPKNPQLGQLVLEAL